MFDITKYETTIPDLTNLSPIDIVLEPETFLIDTQRNVLENGCVYNVMTNNDNTLILCTDLDGPVLNGLMYAGALVPYLLEFIGLTVNKTIYDDTFGASNEERGHKLITSEDSSFVATSEYGSLEYSKGGNTLTLKLRDYTPFTIEVTDPIELVIYKNRLTNALTTGVYLP